LSTYKVSMVNNIDRLHNLLDYMLLFFLLGVPVGFFSASLNEMAKTIEDCSYTQNFANKLNWIDLSAENSMVNFVYDLPFFLFCFLQVLILIMSC